MRKTIIIRTCGASKERGQQIKRWFSVKADTGQKSDTEIILNQLMHFCKALSIGERLIFVGKYPKNIRFYPVFLL
jgi:hypothetical protein